MKENNGFKLMRALCLALDGTVRRSKSGKSFIENADDIELMPGISRLLWVYRQMDFVIIGISNQGGVAHGHKTPQQIGQELDATLKLFNSNPFHMVKMCYHMPDGNVEPYCHRSLLRKPDIGMLAIAEFEAFRQKIIIDWDNSLFVGDQPEDEQCAKNAGIAYNDINVFLRIPHTFKITATETDIAGTKDFQSDPSLIKNIDECIVYYLPKFKGFEKEPEFLKGEDYFASFCHSQLSGGIGMRIRNELGLWADTNLLHRYFVKELGCKHPDSMSDLIIRGIYKKMVSLVMLLLLFAGFTSFGQGITLAPGQSIGTIVGVSGDVTASYYIIHEVYMDTTLFDQRDGFVTRDFVHFVVKKKGVIKDKNGRAVDTDFVYDHRLYLRREAADSAEKYRLLFNEAYSKEGNFFDIYDVYWCKAKLEYWHGRWDAISECTYYDFPKQFSHRH